MIGDSSSDCRPPAIGPRRAVLWAAIVGLLALLSGTAARAQTIAQTFFVPNPEDQVRVWAQAIQPLAENDEIHTVISITATTDETVIYYDHWEDGLEFDASSPTQPTTEAWGDLDCSNGFTPLLVSCTPGVDDALDVIDAGDVLVLEDNVPVPGGVRDPATILFDGADNFTSTGLLAVTRAAWPSTGVEAQLGGAVEVFDTTRWGSAYEAPVGEDLITSVGQSAGQTFEFVAFAILAEEDGTLVEVDTDADTIIDVTQVLNRGQNFLVEDVLVGATVTSSADVQVDLLTGNENTNYEGRWYSLLPTSAWGDTYYSPVGTTVAPDPSSSNLVHAFLYNPGASAIDITVDQLSGCTDVSVAAGSTAEVELALDTPVSAARFASSGLDCGGAAAVGGPFFAVATIDRDDTIHDWGYTLIPESSLTPAAVVGWAPGSTDLSENVSPVWVTAVDPPGGTTTIYVDFDGDPTSGPLIDPVGNRYDTSFAGNLLETVRIFDGGPGSPCGAGDCDQTGMRIYTVDGTRLAAAWGQDPEFSSSSQPQQLDMGTTVLPFSNLSAFKEGTLLDTNGNGVLDPGEALLYTITVINNGIVPITDVFLLDTLDSNTTYVADTTQVDGVPIPDDAGPATPFPLDGDPDPQGYALVVDPDTLDPGVSIVVSFTVTVNDPLVPPDTTQIVNTVTVSSQSEVFVDSEASPVPLGELVVTKSSVITGATVEQGETIDYTITVSNPGEGTLTGIQLLDPAPAGTSYVDPSTSITGPRQRFVFDLFDSQDYDRSDGPHDWATDWVETDTAGPPQSAAAGDVQIELGIGGGELRLEDAGSAIARTVDLSDYTGGFAALLFDFRVTPAVDESDEITIEASSTGGAPFTTLAGPFLGVEGDVNQASGALGFDLSPFISATTAVRIRVSNFYGGASEFFYADNLQIRALDNQQTASDDFSSNSFSGGSGWEAASWTESDAGGAGPAAGQVQVLGGELRLGGAVGNSVSREVDLSGAVFATLTFDYADIGGLSEVDALDIEASRNGTDFVVIGDLVDDDTTGTRSYNITPFISADTTIRFRVQVALEGTERFVIDNVVVRAGRHGSVTKDNTGGTPLVDGALPNLALTDDEFALAPGESLTATFSVLADDVLGQAQVVNTVTATSFEDMTPKRATVRDPVSPGGGVGDRVWLDVDGDGVQDLGEPGIPNVEVVLFLDDDGTPGASGGDTQVATQLTGLDGEYLFGALAPGSYYVNVNDASVPGGLARSPANPDLSDPPIGPVATRTITGTELFTDLDFGYTNASPTDAIIGDRVWADIDDDGIQDPGETGIASVTLDLRSAGPDGAFGTADDVVVGTVATGADGTYLFTGVAAGEYQVAVTDTGGVLAGYTLTSGPQSKPDPTPPFSVLAGQVITDIDFGYDNATLFSIADRAWLDLDGDGAQDAGEPGIPGVTVSLLSDPDGVLDNGDEVVIATAVSDDQGDFSFSGLTNGDYIIRITDTDGKLVGLGGTTAIAKAGTLPVTVAGADVSGVNFGYNAPGRIGDRVWSDADGDGLQDPGEPGIGGVTIELRDASTGSLLATTTTTADGGYLFTELPPGVYFVDVAAAPPGYTLTGDPSEPGGPCSVCDARGVASLTLFSSDLSQDFGYRDTALPDVSGTVFEDLDRDGLLQVSEPRFESVTVDLVDPGPDAQFGTVDDIVVASTTTDASGDYLFPDVAAGDHRVEVTDRGNILDGYTLTSGLDKLPITVAATDLSDLNFGYIRDPATGSIGDSVWFDVDGDGLQGPTEAGIPNVALDLYQDDGDGLAEPTVEVLDGRIDLDGDGDVDGFDDGEIAGIGIIDGRLDLDGDGFITVADDGSFNGATVIDGEIDLDGSGGVDASDDGTLVGDDGLPIATTVTDGNGQYIFAGLGAGSYFVDLREVTLPDSTADGVPDLVETGYPVGDPSAVIALSEGERYEDADFGYVPRPGTAAIGDRVWHDTDGDGAQDDGELGIPGVDIIISGPGGDSTITTGADGFWMATGLSPATSTLYSVNYDAGTVPAGLTQTFPGDISYQVTVNDGDLFTHLDYGFTGGTTGAVGDRVWLDLDGDGFRDTAGPQPEPGLEGVTVSLVRDTNGDGVWDPDGADNLFGTTDDEQILETATTDMSGVYAFSGVPLSDAGDGDAGDADYLVDVTDIGGVLTNLAKTAGAPNTDDNSQADPYPVSLSAGSPTELRADFGYTPAGEFGSLGNKVFRDLDGDGERDPGEPGIEGVTLELWLDVDSDGVITPGTDNLIRSAITDPNGEYELEGLPFGDYLIDLTDDFLVVAGFVKTTGPNPGDDDNSQTDPYAVTLASASDLTGDFGYRADPINSVLTIAGTVFEDTDNDAVFDVGVEPEVENATVFLFRDLDADGELDPADPLIGSQLSDVNGDYLFTDLPVGDYLLAVDVDGTTVDDFLQTTQALTGGVQPVTLPTTDPPDPGAPNSTRNDFGFWNGGIVTNPITLAWFKAEDLGSGVRFAWMTATETGNVGFNLYALGEKGLRRLNDELIPSQVIDSLEPQRYELEVWGIVETAFLLEDVDLLGVRRYHGPFERGETRGVEPKPERIPWGRIRDERMARRKAAAGGRWLAGRRAAFGPRPGPGPKPMPAIWAAARLEVSVDGIHRVSYEQLLAAGIDLTGARAAALALTSGGEPVAIRVESGPRFGPGAFIEFVGEALDTLYTRNNVYTLRVDASLALRVDRENRPAPPWATAPASYAERLAVDRDKRYILTGPGDDPWYEGHLLAYGGSTGRDFDFQIDAYAGGPAALEIELWGLSAFPRDPDHHVLLTWNGSSFAEEWFDGRVVHPVEAELPTGGLVEGTNRLRLTLPGDGGTAWDMVALDRLWVSYARRFVPRQGRLRFEAEAEAFEVEGVAPGEAVVYRLDGEQPVLVDALRYVAEPGGNRVRFAGQKRSAVYQFAEVGALLEPVIAPLTPTARLDGRARLLVISHADFLDEIQPLVERRRAEGWSVAVVDVAAIYALQTHGVVDPQALRDFIALAYAEHETEAVLLVGGDTYDYHDNLGVGSISFVPSLYTATDEIIRYAPVDPLYGDVDGDLVPDLAVGRLPARTPDELSSLVTRILEYGDIAYAGTALLSADAYDVPAGYSFTAASDDLASMLPGWGIERVYLDRLDLAEARDRLIGGINDGVALTSFFGHSGTTAWSFQGLFGVADAETLENSGRPTIVTQWGCWNNYHVTPSYNTLGHKLLLSGDRGAAAVLGAATLTQAPSEQRLGRLLFARLGQPGLTLGAALVEAKQELAQTEPDLIDVILGWTLLGDPTLELGR